MKSCNTNKSSPSAPAQALKTLSPCRPPPHAKRRGGLHTPDTGPNLRRPAGGYLDGALRGSAAVGGRAAQHPRRHRPPHPAAGLHWHCCRRPGLLGAATFPPSLPPLSGQQETSARRLPLLWQRPPPAPPTQSAWGSPQPASEGLLPPVAAASHKQAARQRADPQPGKWRGGQREAAALLTSIFSPMQVAMAPAALPRVPLWVLLRTAAPHHGALRRPPRPRTVRSWARRPFPSPGASILKNRAVTPPTPSAPPQVEAASDAIAPRRSGWETSHMRRASPARFPGSRYGACAVGGPAVTEAAAEAVAGWCVASARRLKNTRF